MRVRPLLSAMGIRDTLEDIGAFIDNEDLTPRHMKILIGVTVGTLVVLGIVSYLVVFVYLGY